MSSSEYIIVGLDPGTKVGVALVSFQGKLIHAFSSKEMELQTIISEATKFGRPLIVGTDKAKIPGLISDFAAKFRAKIVFPDKDLLVEEKRELTKNFALKNIHEIDACASALFAFKKTTPLLNRIKKVLEQKEKMFLFNNILELVIKREMSINFALDYLISPNEDIKIIKSEIDSKSLSEKSFIKLYEKLERERQNNTFLKEEIQKLEKEKNSLMKNISAYERKLFVPKNPEEKHYQNTINSLRSFLEKEKLNAGKLINSLNQYRSILLSEKDFLVAKKLENLGWAEFNQKKNKIFLKEKDILLVRNPNEFSDNTLTKLFELNISHIIYIQKPSKSLQQKTQLAFIDGNKFPLKEFDDFAILSKKDFSEALKEKDLLRLVVEQYKNERNS